MPESTSPAFVAYYRVSTDQQRVSGLGLEAQRAAVRRHIGDASLLAEFTEIESGRTHRNRPQLAAALLQCRKLRAKLVIAKLDRLSRNVHFISGLLESNVDFVCCDNPHANKAMLQMLAVFAELDREQISQRTKAALQATKARGTRLGNPRWHESLPRARAARNPNPAPQVVELMLSHRSQGLTLRAIAAQLNGIGLTTPRGRQWHPETIRTILKRSMQDGQ